MCCSMPPACAASVAFAAASWNLCALLFLVDILFFNGSSNDAVGLSPHPPGWQRNNANFLHENALERGQLTGQQHGQIRRNQYFVYFATLVQVPVKCHHRTWLSVRKRPTDLEFYMYPAKKNAR